MTRIIMNGCNGKMGQVISGLVAADAEAEIVAGIDVTDNGHNPYPVFTDINDCDVEADCLIDFSTASAVDKMLDYCVARNLPCVLCTTFQKDSVTAFRQYVPGCQPAAEACEGRGRIACTRRF